MATTLWDTCTKQVIHKWLSDVVTYYMKGVTQCTQGTKTRIIAGKLFCMKTDHMLILQIPDSHGYRNTQVINLSIMECDTSCLEQKKKRKERLKQGGDEPKHSKTFGDTHSAETTGYLKLSEWTACQVRIYLKIFQIINFQQIQQQKYKTIVH
jgi:hypothetical protein